MKTNNITQPEGNFFDKYSNRNIFVKMIMRNFFQSFDEILSQIKFISVLDAGCGEGHMSDYLLNKYPGLSIDAFDISESVIKKAQIDFPDIHFHTGSIYDIKTEKPYDLVISLEVLEHVDEPERALLEIQNASNRFILLSVPNEPIWRISNFLRGKYLMDYGNTPGHINHWGKKDFYHLCAKFGRIITIKNPFPWTMILIEKF